MTIPTQLPYSDELTMITGVTINYGSTTASTTSTGYSTNYYHLPFLFWVVVATVFLFIAERLIVEILIRLRK